MKRTVPSIISRHLYSPIFCLVLNYRWVLFMSLLLKRREVQHLVAMNGISFHAHDIVLSYPSVRSSVQISALMTEPSVLKLRRMILDTVPHNHSVPEFANSGHVTQK